MIRRAQLLGSGGRAADRVLAASQRIRDGLLRDNKVIPVVLAVLALLIFAWILAGALIGGEPDEKGTGQVASQASQPQATQDSESGDPETPAPEAENRDTDSYAAFDERRDPFELPPGLRSKDDESANGGSGDGGENGSGGDNNGDDGGDNDGDGSNEPSPRGSDTRESGGGGRESSSGDANRNRGGSGGGDGGQGGTGQGGTGQAGGAGSAGSNNGLFDSGGALAAP